MADLRSRNASPGPAARLAGPALAVAMGLGTLAALSGCAPAPSPGSGSAPGSGDPAGTAAASGYVQRISADQLDGWRGVHYDGLVLDVRNYDEWDGPLGHLDGAALIPLGELPARVAEIERYRSRPVLVVCRNGTSALTAAQTLLNNGFKDVTTLDGGLAAYRQMYPITP